MLDNKGEGDITDDTKVKEEMINKIEAQNARMRLMEEENLKLFNEKSYFKNDSEQAFLRSKDLELVFQTTVQDLKQTLQDKEMVIQNMKSDIIKYKEAVQAAHQQTLQAAPEQALQAAPQQTLQAPSQQGLQQATPQATQEPPLQETPRIWRPPGHPPVQVDECVINVRCEGNCEHVTCHKETTHEQEQKVTCYDCKQQFKDRVSMMDHKRDSDHPSKRKCNRIPDCERGLLCWFVHRDNVPPQLSSRAPTQPTNYTCRDCEQVFSDRNELMFHKKRAHPNNIMCSNFLNGYCRRGISGEFCWWSHNQLQNPAPSVERPTISLPPPGSQSWNSDFPVLPTISQSPMVGLQHQLMKALELQRLQQQQQQQQMNIMMSQLMNLSVQPQ